MWMIGRRGSSARVSSVGAGTDRRAREEHGSGAEELRHRRSKILWSAMVLGNATRTRDGRVRTGQTNVGAFRGRRRSLPAGARSGGRAPAGSVRSGSRSACGDAGLVRGDGPADLAHRPDWGAGRQASVGTSLRGETGPTDLSFSLCLSLPFSLLSLWVVRSGRRGWKLVVRTCALPC
jgi:hypothetical protein